MNFTPGQISKYWKILVQIFKKKKSQKKQKINRLRQADKAFDTVDKRETAFIVELQYLYGLLVFVLRLLNGMRQPLSHAIPPWR